MAEDDRNKSNDTGTIQHYQAEPGSDVVTVEVPLSRISGTSSKKGAHKEVFTACTVIGFDTEYQTGDPIGSERVDAKDAQNELLSYQFSVRVIDEDQLNASLQTDGIIIPHNRWKLSDFIAAALGSFSQEHPETDIPAHIYLTGHFTRADLPMFHDFEVQARATMSNVRNTFVSIDNSMQVRLSDDNFYQRSEEEQASQRDYVTLHVRVRDTILLAPDSAKKLSDVAELVGLEKIQLAEDPTEERRIKGQMKELRESNWHLFRRYAIRDAEVCSLYAEKLIRQNQALTGTFKMPVTLTQFGSRLVEQDWKDKGWSADEVLGREVVTEKVFVKKRGHFIPEKKRPFIDVVDIEKGFVTEAYHGGRNEQFMFGICDEGVWRDHDLSSAYATAMAVIRRPHWDQIERVVELDSIKPLDLAYGLVDFDFPEVIRFPTLPVRTNQGIIFPRTGRSFCAAPEISLARDLGAKITLVRSLRVPVGDELVFRDFIKGCIDERNKTPKGSFENHFWKQVGNSTYGKTAQGLQKKRVYDLREDNMVELPESSLTQPFFAAFITSFVRAILGEILNSFDPSTDVFSVTTDGFLSTASDNEIEQAKQGTLFTLFSEARQSLVPNSDALEIKHTIRQPLGWRTRGSASLKFDDKPVLQKGGIKSDIDLSEAEENARVVRLFFNRTPDQIQSYTSGIGLKDMIRENSDFVFRSVEKRLSMEFDWKRKPVDVRDRVVEFEGQTYSHLSFRTRPLTTVDDFNRTRDFWDRYFKKQARCLKTKAQLNRFFSEMAVDTVSTPKAKRYLRAPIDRLRRDLCDAYVHGQAGFPSKRSMKHKAFADLLTEAGVPCKVSDIDNAKKRKFEPHAVPDTQEVRMALARLQERLPYLQIDVLLEEQQ